MTREEIASVCHEANRALCKVFNDHSQVEWGLAPQWQKDSAIKGVEFCILNPDAPASANHSSWMAQKIVDGWAYGPVKDPEKKLHPCIVPFDQLPPEQRVKDHLFKAVVAACVAGLGIAETTLWRR